MRDRYGTSGDSTVQSFLNFYSQLFMQLILLTILFVTVHAQVCTPPGDIHEIIRRNPLSLILDAFNLQHVARNAGKEVNQCLSAMSPDFTMLDECMDTFYMAFGRDGMMTQVNDLLKVVSPLMTMLEQDATSSFVGQVKLLATKWQNQQELNYMCSAMERKLPCLDKIYTAIENWIDQVPDCCQSMNAHLVPRGKTWSSFLSSLTKASMDAVCGTEMACDKDTRCGYHVVSSLMNSTIISKDRVSDYMLIPDGIHSCDALSGRPFQNSNGETTQLFDLGCRCKHYVVNAFHVRKQIPIVAAGGLPLMNEQCDMNTKQDCNSFPSRLTDCSCSINKCKSNVVDSLQTNMRSSGSRLTISYFSALVLLVVSLLWL